MNGWRAWMRRRRALVWIGAVVAVLALCLPIGLYVLRGASGTASGNDSTGNVANSGSAGSGGATEPSPPGGQKSESGATYAAGADASAVDATKLVRTAFLEMTVTDATTAASRVRAITSAAGGRIISENVVLTAVPQSGPRDAITPLPPPDGFNEARVVLGVPNDKLDAVLTQLSEVGNVTHRTTQSEDVTDTYVDTQARVATMQAGVDRLRALVAQATSLGQIVSLEGELTRRQADLDALRARLTQLERRAAQSQVTVTMTTGPTGVDNGGGILGALRGAWEAFLASATAILTGLAAVLPWLVVLAVIVLIGRRLLRRRPGRTPKTD